MNSNRKPWEVVILDDLREDLLLKVVDFLNGFFPKNLAPRWSADYFRWKLYKNPAGRGFLSCAIAGSEVVGTASITLKRIWYKNKITIAGETGDTFTHPNYRKQRKTKFASQSSFRSPSDTCEYLEKSIFGRLVYENTMRALDNGIEIIYGTPNENSRPGYEKRLNYRSHPMREMNLVRPSVMGIISSSKLSFLRKFLLVKPIVGIMFKAESLVEAINFNFWERKRKKLGYTFKKVSRASADLNQLWERLRYQNEFSLVRDQASFQHRFFDNPLGEYDVYKAVRQGELYGVIVTRVYPIAEKIRNCCIADWFFDESKKDVFPCILAYVIHDKHHNAHYFTSWCPEGRGLISIFHRLGFVSTSKKPVIFYRSEEGKELLERCRSLDFTIASSDNV